MGSVPYEDRASRVLPPHWVDAFHDSRDYADLLERIALALDEVRREAHIEACESAADAIGAVGGDGLGARDGEGDGEAFVLYLEAEDD